MTAAQWSKKVEDIAHVYEWDDKTLLFYVVSKLKGAARHWYDSVAEVVASWEEFKLRLCNSFPAEVDQLEVHRRLTQRTKKSTESYENYVYEMAAIAQAGHIETRSLIKYILSEFNERDLAKSLAVCNFANIQELLLRIRDYESLTQMQAKPRSTKFNEEFANKCEMTRTNDSKSTQVRCYTCGNLGHTTRAWPNREKGPKCFHCNKFGHKATECPEKSTQTCELYRRDRCRLLIFGFRNK